MSEKLNKLEEGFIPEELKYLDPSIIENVLEEALQRNTQLKWNNVIGFSYVKKFIQESVMSPFTTSIIDNKPQNLLLFGPPGVGKTLVGKALGSGDHECKTTYFSISACSLMSCWMDKAEKIIKTLFILAKYLQPSIVVIDDIDCLFSKEGGYLNNQQINRMVTELIIQLDDVTTSKVLFVGITNRPENIDNAFIGRMHKRLYITLPSKEDKKEILKYCLSNCENSLSEEEIDEVVTLIDGYSVSDIKVLCSESALLPLREVMNSSNMNDIMVAGIRPVTLNDFKKALKTVFPSIHQRDLEVFEKWNKEYGNLNFEEI
ncbi:hypothetical protein ABK040_006870 [Willaertia magna]